MASDERDRSSDPLGLNHKITQQNDGNDGNTTPFYTDFVDPRDPTILSMMDRTGLSQEDARRLQKHFNFDPNADLSKALGVSRYGPDDTKELTTVVFLKKQPSSLLVRISPNTSRSTSFSPRFAAWVSGPGPLGSYLHIPKGDELASLFNELLAREESPIYSTGLGPGKRRASKTALKIAGGAVTVAVADTFAAGFTGAVPVVDRPVAQGALAIATVGLGAAAWLRRGRPAEVSPVTRSRIRAVQTASRDYSISQSRGR
jgi:hypothetical protein